MTIIMLDPLRFAKLVPASARKQSRATRNSHKLWTDQSGNGLPLVLILVFVLMLLSITVYTIFMLNISHQEARDGLERSGIAAINKTLQDADVRDIDFSLYIASIQDNLQNTLVQELHLTQSGTSYLQIKDGHTLYRLENVQLAEANGIISITAEQSMLLPWDRSGQFVFRVPILIRLRSLYLG